MLMRHCLPALAVVMAAAVAACGGDEPTFPTEQVAQSQRVEEAPTPQAAEEYSAAQGRTRASDVGPAEQTNGDAEADEGGASASLPQSQAAEAGSRDVEDTRAQVQRSGDETTASVDA
ncbi:MAG: hypothetical protein F4Y69_11685 [Chloroflexi bacterium]|nr:hypothetical protein [Chloroflexota bacterium]MYF21742.1 hypothetical protein [Chloroflexota bacterium]